MNLRRAWDRLRAAPRDGAATPNKPAGKKAHLVLGARGEEFAARYLQQHGYTILTRNFRGRQGELDIVARHQDMLVFVEVKTRRAETISAPQDAVNLAKQKHLAKVGFEYIRLLADQQLRSRFDIVEVILSESDREPRAIRVIQNAFELPPPYLY